MRSVGFTLLGVFGLLVLVVVILGVMGVIQFRRDDGGAQIHVETERLEEVTRNAAHDTGEALERAGERLQDSADRPTDRSE